MFICFKSSLGMSLCLYVQVTLLLCSILKWKSIAAFPKFLSSERSFDIPFFFFSIEASIGVEICRQQTVLPIVLEEKATKGQGSLYVS